MRARRHRRRGGLADEDRALVADDLGAHVVAPGTGARDVQRGDRAAVEAHRHRRVVEVADRLELRVDRALPGRVHLDRLLAEEPARGVVVVRRHVEQEAAGRNRILGLGRPHVAGDADHEQRPADVAGVDPPPSPRPTARRSAGGSRPARPSRPRRPPRAPRRARRASSRPASRGTGASPPRARHTPARRGRSSGRRGRPHRCPTPRTARRRCTRARRAPARRQLPAPAGSTRPRRAGPSQRSAFRAWTVPIPPRPATPSLTLDTANATMTASQSLAQPFEERSRRDARGRREESRRLGVDGLARPERARRALRPDARRGRRRRPRRSSSSRRSSPGRCARRPLTRSASSSRTSRARSTPRRSRAHRRRCTTPATARC